MLKPVASVIPLTVRVRLHDAGKHQILGSTPDLIEIARRSDSAARLPAQAAEPAQSAADDERIAHLAMLLAEVEFDTLVVGKGFVGMFSASTAGNVRRSDLMPPLMREKSSVLRECVIALQGPQSGAEAREPGAPESDTVPILSDRQRAVLLYAACGYRPAQTADAMNISEHTVRMYLSTAKSALGARTIAQATALAVSHELIDTLEFNRHDRKRLGSQSK